MDGGDPKDVETAPIPIETGSAAKEQIPIAVAAVEAPAPSVEPAAENSRKGSKSINKNKRKGAKNKNDERRSGGSADDLRKAEERAKILEKYSTTSKPRQDKEAQAGPTIHADDMRLNGQPLEKPTCFIPKGWEPGKSTFGPDDDPDRTKEPWDVPSFCSRDPALQQSKLVVRELELPSKPKKFSFARVVEHLLDEKDCAEIIQKVNAKGFTPALKNYGNNQGLQKWQPEIRDGWRAIVDCQELTFWILEVLRPHLPAELTLEDGDETVQLHSVNERCRFLLYKPEQQFKVHTDSTFVHPRTGATSRVTIQIYLHDVPEANGGATTFLELHKLRSQPKAGAALIFTQDLRHEGSKLHQGLKYTFRTEALYKGGRQQLNTRSSRVSSEPSI